jgi:hypothetical protein
MGEGRCLFCKASVRFTSPSGHRVESHIKGTDGKEVLEVVKAIMNDAKGFSSGNITISGTVGIFNTGTMENIQSISTNIGKLEKNNETDVAKAFKALTEAVASSGELDDTTRSDLIEQLEELSNQATLSADKRVKTGVIKGMFVGLATGLSAAGGLAEVWSTWGPAISAYFGI